MCSWLFKIIVVHGIHHWNYLGSSVFFWHPCWHFESYCITLSKPRGKAITSLKYSIKHRGLNHFGLHYHRGICSWPKNDLWVSQKRFEFNHAFWHYEGYCITLLKPRGKSKPTLGVSKQHENHHFGIGGGMGIPESFNCLVILLLGYFVNTMGSTILV